MSAPAPAAPPAARSVAAALNSKRTDGLFLVGITLGAWLMRLTSRQPVARGSLGRHFDALYAGLGHWVWLLLFGAGLLLGFGARMSGGCTSGHGISGVSAGERGSLLSTATFWSIGVAVAWGVWMTVVGAR